MKELVPFIMPKVAGLQSKYNNEEFYCKDIFKDNENLKRLITYIGKDTYLIDKGYIYDQYVIFDLGKDAEVYFVLSYGDGYEAFAPKVTSLTINLGKWECRLKMDRNDYSDYIEEDKIIEIVKCVLLYNHVVTKLNSVSLKKAERMQEEIAIKKHLESVLKDLTKSKAKTFNKISQQYSQMLEEAFNETERYAMFCKAINANMISKKIKFEKFSTDDNKFELQLNEEIEKNIEKIDKDINNEKSRRKIKDFFCKIVLGSQEYKKRDTIRTIEPDGKE